MIFFLLGFIFSACEYDDDELQAACEVIQRQVPESRIDEGLVQLSKINSTNGNPVYEYYSKSGVLYIKGSTGFSICHGFYQFMKSNNYGMITWSGRNVHWPPSLQDTAPHRQESVVRYHYNFNVVTFGYTMPFFD